ncbi:family with sequence similarity 129 member B [Cricetulus griseus]
MENGVNERWGSLEGAGPWHYSLGGLFMARTGSFRASAQPPSMALQPALCSGMVDTFQGVLFKSVEELRIWVHCGEWEVEKTEKILREFLRFYEDQYGVSLFNSMRHEIEGTGPPQSQLLWRKGYHLTSWQSWNALWIYVQVFIALRVVPYEELTALTAVKPPCWDSLLLLGLTLTSCPQMPLEERIIFSGNLFQYQEDNKKWRNRFSLVPHNYGLVLYENHVAYERQMPPRAIINSAGYKVLTSVDQYLELVGNSLPGITSKSGSTPILKCPTQFPLILWHPYARHYYFCMMTEAEQDKWQAVLQDCVRHCNNGIPENSKVEGPAFTDAIRMYRQSKEQYGTWEMLCGNEVQILSNLVMEELGPALKAELGPRLKGKPQERQRQWIQISDAVYRLVFEQAKVHFEEVLSKLQLSRPAMEAVIRTDMDQIITSKEHLASKIRGPGKVWVHGAMCLCPLQYMEKLSQLAYHPLKMQSCYEKMEPLRLDGLQQRFDVSSTSVFKQRAQIHMREQMDNAVYTFETLLHQELGKGPTKEELCKSIQRILERVLKKYDYDSSSVRKRFFREALLQITIPFLLKKLAPTCKSELPRFQELIFEDFARFILVENTYEEVVLQTVMKDILQAVKEAAVQRKHNLYRDSIVLHNSDPNLHLLAEGAPIDWGEQYGDSGDGSDSGGSPSPSEAATLTEKRKRVKQVVSVIQDEESGLPFEAGSELPSPASPDSVTELRGLLAQDLQAESPPPASPLLNGAPVQESPQPIAVLEASSPPASPLGHLPPGKAMDIDIPKPSDQETGEQVSSPGSRPPIHTTTEDSAGVQTEF